MKTKLFKRPLQRFRAGALALCVVSLGWASSSPAERCPIDAGEFRADPAATSVFLTKRCDFETTGVNPFLILVPGYRIVLESDEGLQRITVLRKTRVVNGVTTRVVEEFEYEKDGDELIPVERSLNYIAMCRQTNSMFYFGEDVQFFDEDGNVTGSQGAWHAGENGARPGIVMPGTILVGGSYYEEIAPEDSALDKGTVVSLEKGCEAGDFEFERLCLAVEGSNDCNSDTDSKLYVKGIGVVADDDLEITKYGFVRDDDDDDDRDEKDD